MSEPIFKVGDVVKTRNGGTARILYVELKGKYPLVAIHTRNNGEEFVETHLANGREVDETWADTSDLDLLPPERVRYVNVYGDARDAGIHDSRAEADHSAGASRTERVRITYRPGQMDE